MTTYTLADASQPAIVRTALNAALVSGEPRPRVMFGSWATDYDASHLRALVATNGTWTVGTWCLGWTETPERGLTTEQAVAAIVAARNERD